MSKDAMVIVPPTTQTRVVRRRVFVLFFDISSFGTADVLWGGLAKPVRFNTDVMGLYRQRVREALRIALTALKGRSRVGIRVTTVVRLTPM